MKDGKPERILVAGGGTGGHIFTGLAVVEAMRRTRPVEVLFVGTRRSLEKQLLNREGVSLAFVDIEGISGKGLAGWLRFLWLAPWSIWQSFRLVRSFRPRLAIGLGGYSSGPVLWVASRMGVATLILEPNAVPGLANRWLKRCADAIAVAFEETRAHLGERGQVTGIPVRPEFFGVREVERPAGFFRVLLFGGSQGSHRLNQLWLEALPHLEKSWDSRRGIFQVVHQTGEKDYRWVKEAYDRVAFPHEVHAFIHRMAEEFSRANLIVCRSGAGTLGELCAAGRAALLVPFPFSADQHQKANAEVLARKGAAMVAAEAELDGARLAAWIVSAAADTPRIGRMEEAAAAMAERNADEKIARLAWQMIDRKAA